MKGYKPKSQQKERKRIHYSVYAGMEKERGSIMGKQRRVQKICGVIVLASRSLTP